MQKSIEEHIAVSQSLFALYSLIEEFSNKTIDVLTNNKKVIFAGNGGSAADSQHLAAEFTGRFLRERKSLNAVALTVDTSALTAIGNDYSFDRVFSRQLEGIGQEGDLFVGISTSGNSKNIIECVKIAKEKGIFTVALLGNSGGKLKDLADLSIVVPSTTTARIQEMHILIGHLLCEAVDEHFV